MHLSTFTKELVITTFIRSIKGSFDYNDMRHVNIHLYRCTSKLLKPSPN